MPDWNSPAELAVEGGVLSSFLFQFVLRYTDDTPVVAAFGKFMHALAGLYLYAISVLHCFISGPHADVAT